MSNDSSTRTIDCGRKIALIDELSEGSDTMKDVPKYKVGDQVIYQAYIYKIISFITITTVKRDNTSSVEYLYEIKSDRDPLGEYGRTVAESRIMPYTAETESKIEAARRTLREYGARI